MLSGSCSFNLWKVAVDFDGATVHRVRFLKSADAGSVPVQFTKFLAGKGTDFSPLTSSALLGDSVYARIYREVSKIPYGKTKTYGEIAEAAGTHANNAAVVRNQLFHGLTVRSDTRRGLTTKLGRIFADS